MDATSDVSVFSQVGLPTENGRNFMSYIAQGYSDENVEQYRKSNPKSMLSLRKWRLLGSDLFGNGHMIPFMPQFWTIRHIVGEYDFVAVDGEYFEDTVGSCGDFCAGMGAGKHCHTAACTAPNVAI